MRLTNNTITLCKACFSRYLEAKVKKTIRKHHLIEKGDHIGIAVSGGKDSSTLLHLLGKTFKERKDIKITAIAIDEGIEGYRDECLNFVKPLCEKYKIPLYIKSFKEEIGTTLDEVLKKEKIKPCSFCGVMRRYLLNKTAKELGITKLATGHNLDDEAQTILLNQIRRNTKTSARLGPLTGIIDDKKFIRRIKPLYFLTEKEIATYAYLHNLMTRFNECPHSHEAVRDDIRNLLNTLEAKYEGTKQSIVAAFLETLPSLKEHYKKEGNTLKYCQLCEEPSSQEICQRCNLLNKYSKKSNVILS